MKKHKRPQKDMTERWLLTYSDLMNLLLILFIILFCASKIDAEKAAAVAQSMREGFGYVEQSAEQGEAGELYQMTDGNPDTYWSREDLAYQEFFQEILALLKKEGLLESVDISLDDRGVVISFKDTALFSSGSAELSADAAELIDGIGTMLNELSFSFILIEGHTDSDPISTSRYKDNMDLSTQRAGNVWRELTKMGLPAEKMASIGYGETRPVADNDTAENKAKNRRVVISILRAEVMSDEEIAAGAAHS